MTVRCTRLAGFATSLSLPWQERIPGSVAAGQLSVPKPAGRLSGGPRRSIALERQYVVASCHFQRGRVSPDYIVERIPSRRDEDQNTPVSRHRMFPSACETSNHCRCAFLRREPWRYSLPTKEGGDLPLLGLPRHLLTGCERPVQLAPNISLSSVRDDGTPRPPPAASTIWPDGAFFILRHFAYGDNWGASCPAALTEIAAVESERPAPSAKLSSNRDVEREAGRSRPKKQRHKTRRGNDCGNRYTRFVIYRSFTIL
jgi:hypothetical protein